MARKGKGLKDKTLWLSEEDLELIQKWNKIMVKNQNVTKIYL